MWNGKASLVRALLGEPLSYLRPPIRASSCRVEGPAFMVALAGVGHAARSFQDERRP
jgi:hypothetical protein